MIRVFPGPLGSTVVFFFSPFFSFILIFIQKLIQILLAVRVWLALAVCAKRLHAVFGHVVVASCLSRKACKHTLIERSASKVVFLLGRFSCVLQRFRFAFGHKRCSRWAKSLGLVCLGCGITPSPSEHLACNTLARCYADNHRSTLVLVLVSAAPFSLLSLSNAIHLVDTILRPSFFVSLHHHLTSLNSILAAFTDLG